MARSKDFISGWSMGWTSATEALLRSLDQLAFESGPSSATAREVVRLEAAGNKPAFVQRRRGRPPKSAASVEPPRRRRGRPPKSA